MPRLRRVGTSRRARQVYGIIAVVFVVINLTTFVIYQGRTYPNTTIAGQHLGTVGRNNLAKKIASLTLLPKEAVLTQNKQTTPIVITELGVEVDTSSLAQQAMHERHWLPAANFFTGHEINLQLHSDSTRLQDLLRNKLSTVDRPATDAKLVIKNNAPSITPESDGQKLDAPATANRLLNNLSKGQIITSITTQKIAPKVTTASLRPQLESVQKQLKIAITLQYQDKNKSYSAADLASLFTENGSGLVVSDSLIKASVITVGTSFDISVNNTDAAVGAIKNALTSQKNLRFTLEARPYAKVFNYCTAVRGVSESELPTLSAALQKTYNDSRGWNIGGLIKFQPGPAGSTAGHGCDFTVWLASADQMASFGAICDPVWSCTVPPNVVINYDRWRYATDSWQAAQAGSIDEYRSMAINHETGHELGFGHTNCPGPGQPAPVMQQQSIDLQGCVFNPWPTAKEQAALRQRLGI